SSRSYSAAARRTGACARVSICMRSPWWRTMRSCEVLIVGGGPGGSSCASRLVRAGVDVLVMDRSRFPRQKVCAGWVTPPVFASLDVDLDDYRRGRVLQPITATRT